MLRMKHIHLIQEPFKHESDLKRHQNDEYQEEHDLPT